MRACPNTIQQEIMQTNFSSRKNAWLGKLVNPAALEAVVSRFESETGQNA